MASIRLLATAGAVSLFALAAQAAEPVVQSATQPVPLNDAQLEQVTAGAGPDLGGGTSLAASAYSSSALPDIIIWDIDGGDGPGGPAGASADSGVGDDGISGVGRLRIAF